MRIFRRQVHIKIDSLSSLAVSVARLRRIAVKEPSKEIFIKYFKDMDPSGDDMDRDLCRGINDISAKLNVDRFDNKKRTSGENYLRELTVTDIEIGHLEYNFVKAKRKFILKGLQ